jgi:two-component system, NtrC family, sensor kinase
MMPLFSRLKPAFWNETTGGAQESGLFNYRRIWKLTVLCVSLVAIIPLIILALMDYNLSRKAIQAESLYPITRLVSNTGLSISSFLQERMSVLNFIIRNNSFRILQNQEYLDGLLHDVNAAFGGFVDLGVIDSSGTQLAYSGPFDFRGKDYSDQDWFSHVMEQEFYISDVFKGFRDAPHFVMAVKMTMGGDSVFVLRATIDTERFYSLISSLNVRPLTDTFVINTLGVLQTPSNYHGQVLEHFPYAIPTNREGTAVSEIIDINGEMSFLASVSIENSPFQLVLIKPQKELMENWWQVRMELLGFMVISITSILVVILTVATYLVSRIHDADLKRTIALHNMEHTSKMASIGRLAAGVAHEINNPLAIINEKAGLLKDLIVYSGRYGRDEKLLGLVDSVIRSVERCSTITHRLLGFAKHINVQWERVRIEEVIREVLGFLGKEAEYRNIHLALDVKGDIPDLTSDKGQLQQIFLNIVNNAFAAVPDGGAIGITVWEENGLLNVSFQDNGCGISPENMKRIFEPFFSTKHKHGTGLGLSITYGLVKKLGGVLNVQSELHKGSTFTVSFPLKFTPADHRKGPPEDL